MTRLERNVGTLRYLLTHHSTFYHAWPHEPIHPCLSMAIQAPRPRAAHLPVVVPTPPQLPLHLQPEAYHPRHSPPSLLLTLASSALTKTPCPAQLSPLRPISPQTASTSLDQCTCFVHRATTRPHLKQTTHRRRSRHRHQCMTTSLARPASTGLRTTSRDWRTCTRTTTTARTSSIAQSVGRAGSTCPTRGRLATGRRAGVWISVGISCSDPNHSTRGCGRSEFWSKGPEGGERSNNLSNKTITLTTSNNFQGLATHSFLLWS